MPSCPNCGKLNADDAIFCSNCGASLGSMSQRDVSKPFQSEATLSSSPLPAASSTTSNFSAGELSQRLEKALRRTELLSYAAIGLSLFVLIYIVVLFYG